MSDMAARKYHDERFWELDRQARFTCPFVRHDLERFVGLPSLRSVDRFGHPEFDRKFARLPDT